MPWDPNELLSQIEAKYDANDWVAEGDHLRLFFEHFAERSANDLLDPKYLSKGGSGLAVRFARTDERIGVVLKVARPISAASVDLDDVLDREARLLGRIRHPNVVRLVERGSQEIDDRRYSYYTTELLDDPLDSDEYLVAKNQDGEYLVSDSQLDGALETIIRDAISGLAAIHELDLLHSDIKPQNIFVERSGRAVLGDFGFALDLSKIGSTESMMHVGGTYGYMHPDLATTVQDYSDKRRVQATVPKRSKDPAWDLYSLGLTVIELLRIADVRTPRLAASSTRRYLRLLGARLLDGRNDAEELRPLRLSKPVFEEIKYSTATEALDDIRRQMGELTITQRVPELLSEQESAIPATPIGPVPSTKRTLAIIDSVEILRLDQVLQLGLLKFVYPTATHSRRQHVLGTYAACIRYVRALDADRTTPLFRSIMRQDDICAVLVASLVHDIGHYSLAHDLEEAELRVFDHERRTQSILENPSIELRHAIEDAPPDGWGVPISRVLDILAARPFHTGSIRDQILHSILDGPIDCDKVDYLTRDSEHMILPYGDGIDHAKLISSLSVHVKPDEVRPGAQITITDRGRIAAESVAFARYAMYGAGYWQHTHRSAKAMLNRLVWLRLQRASQVSSRNYRKQIQDSLYKFLHSEPEMQQPLFYDEPVPLSERLDEGSKRVLRWLIGDDSIQSLRLATMLANRNLYKRGYVFTKGGNDGIDFSSLDRLFSRSSSWEAKLSLSERIENEIIDLVRARETLTRNLSAAEQDEVTKLLGHDPADIVCLVDFPPAKSGSRVSLASLPEGQAEAYNEPVKSALWRTLADSQGAGSAKLRILLHPSHVSIVTSLISRSDMVDRVNRVVEEMES